MKKTDKQDKFARFEEAALKVIAEKGLRGLNVSYVATKAGLSRAWIYKYVGRDRQQLIKAAAMGLGRRFARLDDWSVEGKTPQIQKKAWREGASITLDYGKKYPWVTELFFAHVGKQNPLGQAIDEISQQHVQIDQAKFEKIFGKSKSEAKRLAAQKLTVRMTYAHLWGRLPQMSEFSKEQLVDQLCWFFEELRDH